MGPPLKRRRPSSGVLLRYEADLQAIVEREKDEHDAADVLEHLARSAKLLAATERLRQLMRKDAALGGPGSLFELEQDKDGVMRLVGEGGRMVRRVRVREFDEVRLVGGITEIRARVDLEAGGDAPTTQLHFHFTRRPGPRRGTSMPYPEEVDADGEPVPRGGGKNQKQQQEQASDGGTEAEPTTIVEYVVSATDSPAEPLAELLHVVIYGLSPSGTPSPAGIRGPEGEEGEEGQKEPKDLGLVEVDGEAMQAAMAWCGTSWGEAEFLNFLLFFPYHEEEWDVAGCVMDKLLGYESEDEDEEEDEESEEDEAEDEAPSVRLQLTPSPPRQRTTKNKGGKRAAEAAAPQRQKGEQRKRPRK